MSTDYITDEQMAGYVTEIGKSMAEALTKMKREINQTIEAQQKEIDALKAAQANSLRYVGIWESTRQYDVGEVVSHSGSMWHCNVRTTQRPGNGSGDWTMCVKSGQQR